MGDVVTLYCDPIFLGKYPDEYYTYYKDGKIVFDVKGKEKEQLYTSCLTRFARLYNVYT